MFVIYLPSIYRKLKVSLLAGSGVVAATTLTLLYAKYDKNFREQLCVYLPFINSLLSNEQKLIEATKYDDSFIKKKSSQTKLADSKVIEAPLPKVDIPKPVVETKKPEQLHSKDALDEKTIKQEIAKTFERAINEDNVSVCYLGLIFTFANSFFVF